MGLVGELWCRAMGVMVIRMTSEVIDNISPGLGYRLSQGSGSLLLGDGEHRYTVHGIERKIHRSGLPSSVFRDTLVRHNLPA